MFLKLVLIMNLNSCLLYPTLLNHVLLIKLTVKQVINVLTKTIRAKPKTTTSSNLILTIEPIPKINNGIKKVVTKTGTKAVQLDFTPIYNELTNDAIITEITAHNKISLLH